MENKNTIIAILLMLLVWVGFTVLFPPASPPPPADVAPSQQIERQEAPVAQPQVSAAPLVSAETPFSLQPRQTDRYLTIKTPSFVMEIAESPAAIRYIELLQYRQTQDPQSPGVVLLDTRDLGIGTLQHSGTDGFAAAGQPVFDLLEGPTGSVNLTSGQTQELVFQGEIAAGVYVQKVFTISADSYQVPVTLRLVNQGPLPLSGNLLLSLAQPWDDEMSGTMYEFVGPSTHAGGKKRKDKVDDLKKDDAVYTQQINWTGFEKKYFFNGLVPVNGFVERARVHRSDNIIFNTLATSYLTLAPGEQRAFEFFGYFGPKDLSLLQGLGYGLSEAVDYGFFGFLARPLLHVLIFFNQYLHNYGLAIILLTVIIKILFWPLTQKSFTSMKGMQKLQPQMQKLREKYKNDKQRMNMELMNLYKEHRVNPLGGCLPMLVQIPVFFALYKVLLVSIEMRHAHFFLWITDLSAKDPYYVTPLLMGASMFLQQKLTPSTLDPIQARIFLAMPIIFTVLFLNFPAGLVLYWLVNNILTIGQQVMIHRKN